MLFPDQHARYASIGGKPNPQQPELIRSAAARMPHGADVVAAMDADADGRKLAEYVRKAVEMTGRSDLRFGRRSLQASRTGTTSCAPNLNRCFRIARRCLPSPEIR